MEISSGSVVRRGVLVIVGAAAIGWVTGSLWTHRAGLATVYARAVEQHYLALTAGRPDVVTWLVHHDDFDALRRYAAGHDEIVGVEVFRWPDVAVVAVRGRGSGAIRAIATLPGVNSIERRLLPMICHR